MITALCGTPGTGKTTTAEVLRANGLNVMSATQLARDLGVVEGTDPVTGELVVDLDRYSSALAVWAREVQGDLMVEGHLSYLVPGSLTLLLRTDPNILLDRLRARGYPERKAMENAEAEAVSYLLFECKEREDEVLSGRDWTTLPDDCPLVLEIDATTMGPEERAGWARAMMGARKEKRFIDMLPFRPPVVDWVEVIAGWY